ncbi:VOC family protein [Cohnella sp.]|uniref:VOC family protein n=1 Tax=Cohnella sp. TaxID=1883426 RepID=UPI0035686DE6
MTFEYVGINHVQLASPPECESQARNFYGLILKMSEIEKPENLKKRGGVWFQCGVHQIHIGVQQNFVPAKKAHPAFEITDLEALRKRLAEEGVPIIEDVPLEGYIRLFVNDPFGNRIELLQRVEP